MTIDQALTDHRRDLAAAVREAINHLESAANALDNARGDALAFRQTDTAHGMLGKINAELAVLALLEPAP